MHTYICTFVSSEFGVQAGKRLCWYECRMHNRSGCRRGRDDRDDMGGGGEERRPGYEAGRKAESVSCDRKLLMDHEQLDMSGM